MEKRVVEKKAIQIEEVAELYKNFTLKSKEADAAAKPYKEQLLEFAKDNPGAFDGNTLMFQNGVRVELRESEKAKWDDDAVDYEWAGDAIDAGLGKAVCLTINPKGFPDKTSKEQKALLKDIGYKVEKTQTYAVYASEKK